VRLEWPSAATDAGSVELTIGRFQLFGRECTLLTFPGAHGTKSTPGSKPQVGRIRERRRDRSPFLCGLGLERLEDIRGQRDRPLHNRRHDPDGTTAVRPNQPEIIRARWPDLLAFDDPVPPTVVLSLDDAFRVLEAIEDARVAVRERGAAPGLQDELATVIRMLRGGLGLDEGGAL